jgi:hypothetical protein
MSEALAAKVRAELARYEHPLFDFEAHTSPHGVEVEIRCKSSAVEPPRYLFELQPRELESSQFPWMFQKQLYDCLHDYIIEMFIRNPQREN